MCAARPSACARLAAALAMRRIASNDRAKREETMRGLMQDWPLLCHKLIDHAAKQHGAREIVSRSVEGPIHRTNYRQLRSRALRVAKRLDTDGFKQGQRAATLAWNTWRHMEVWFGLLGIGGVYHTVNPRLFPEQIAW